jgi:hypothetical protein
MEEAGSVAHLGHEVHAASFRRHLGDPGRRIGEIAEVAGVHGTGVHAGGLAVSRGDVLVVNPVDAERALLHHAADRVELAGAVGASPGAQPAADAAFLLDQDDAVLLALVGRAGRADGDACRVLAMQAGLGEVNGAAAPGLLALLGAHLVAVHPVQPGAGLSAAVGVEVAERRRIAAGVPFLAADHAGMAADADVQVDHQAEALRRRNFWKAGHDRLRLPSPVVL